MVTYPSTHGVFEDAIRDICAAVHEHGGQVYMDGANMNAQVGLTSPALIGADVCHINLHKTFAIPHGGGGPGMGPIARGGAPGAVPAGPSAGADRRRQGHPAGVGGAVGQRQHPAHLLRLHPHARRRRASPRRRKYAILNANYIKARLQDHYDVLYTRPNGRVAHEMIFDLRKFKAAGVEEGDVAKRLMDYGFHAPTVSFPVPGTLMVEPTESEPKAELDRFCDALIAIRAEIDAVVSGAADAEGQRAEERAAHRRGGDGRQLDASLHARGGGVPAAVGAGAQVLAAASAASTTPTATATWSASVRRWRPTRTEAGRRPLTSALHARSPVTAMRVLNAKQMRAVDRQTIDELGLPSIVLMENAGRQVVAAMESLVDELAVRRVAVLCGTGSNGGDGFVVARTLQQRGVEVTVYVIGALGRRPRRCPAEPRHHRPARRCRSSRSPTRRPGSCTARRSPPPTSSSTPSSAPGSAARSPGCTKRWSPTSTPSAATVVAIDLPSGLSADTSELIGPVLEADSP